MESADFRIACPDCPDQTLTLRLTCLAAWLSCPACRRSFSVEELAPKLDEATFERLADLLGGRLSDRV